MRCGLLACRSGVVTAALPEVQPALVIVVTPAAQLDLLHRRLTAEGVGVHVMELHEPALIAPMAARADELATSDVPNPDGAFHCRRGVTRPRVLRARPTRLPRVGKLLLGQVYEQCGEGPVEDGGVIPGRDGVAEHVLRQPQLLERLTADPIDFLHLHPLLQFQRDGGSLEPGQLLASYPPFVCEESRDGVSLSAVPATERLCFLADFARQFAGIADGEQCRITVSE